MVRKEERNLVDYFCEKCHYPYPTEEEAIKCENKEPIRKIMHNGEKYDFNEWHIGDIVIVHHHDDDLDNLRLAIINNEVIEGHEILPVFKFINGKKETFNWGHEEVMFLTDKAKLSLIEIGNYLSGRTSIDSINVADEL